MIVLALVLMLVGWLFGFHPLVMIGLILLAVGLVALVAGLAGHAVGGRSHWY